MTGPQEPTGTPQQPPGTPLPAPPPNRLYRSRTDRILGGVAAGVAVQLNLDPSLVRVGWVLLAIFTGGLFGLVYLVMWIVVPESPGWPVQPAAPAAGPGAMPGWQPPGPPGAPPGQQYVETTPGYPPPAAAGLVAGATAGSAGEPPPGADLTGAAGAASAPDSSGWPTVASEPGAEAPRPPDTGAAGMNTASIVIGLILVVIGGVFLLEQLIPQFSIGDFWPLVPIVIGGALLYTALRPRPGG